MRCSANVVLFEVLLSGLSPLPPLSLSLSPQTYHISFRQSHEVLRLNYRVTADLAGTQFKGTLKIQMLLFSR